MLNILVGMLVCFVRIVNVSVESGVSLDGCVINEYLVVSVGVIFCVIMVLGKFYGVIDLIMLMGCFRMIICLFG